MPILPPVFASATPHISPTSTTTTRPPQLSIQNNHHKLQTTTTTTFWTHPNNPQNQSPPPIIYRTTPSTPLTLPHNPNHNPIHPPTPTEQQEKKRKMCQYTYTLFTCGHGTHIWAEDIELCPTHRLLSAHGPSPFDGLECPSSVGTCEGVNDWLCDECTEVWDLELGCERDG